MQGGTMILNISAVNKKYNTDIVLNNFSLTMDKKDRNAILGASGTGKTTLLRIILGLAPADSGSVSAGDNLHQLVVFQEDRLLMPFSAVDNINIYPYPFDENKALQLLSQLGLDDAAVSQKHANEYSGGMKRRLAIARALYGCTRVSELFPGEPILLIMDEPFKGLDSELKDKVILTVSEVLEATAGALLLVTHDEKEAAALGCSLIKL